MPAELPNQSQNLTAAQPNSWVSWVRLTRVTNLPSAVSNILMAFLVAHQSWDRWPELLLLIAASACLYLGGMVLNDWFDVELDRGSRPDRPLPAGEISLRAAAVAGFGLLLLGVALAGAAGLSSTELGSARYRPPVIASLLAVCVYLYDGPLKRTLLAPLVMGGCRFLNVLLGASTGSVAGPLAPAEATTTWLGFPSMIWWIAASIGILIWGVTLLGRNESSQQQNWLQLAAGGAIIFVGLLGIATVAYSPSNAQLVSAQVKSVFPLFIAAISITVVRRVVTALVARSPGTIQAAVISVLRSLVIYDAALCYLAAPEHPGYAIAVVSLILPSLILSRLSSGT